MFLRNRPSGDSPIVHKLLTKLLGPWFNGLQLALLDDV
jgi:hypothetical protein